MEEEKPVTYINKAYNGDDPCQRCGGWGWRLIGINWIVALSKWASFKQIPCPMCRGTGQGPSKK